MQLDVAKLARMVDVSVVRANVDYEELKELAEFARRYKCIGAHPMTCYVRELSEMLRDVPEVLVGGVVGFPFGSQPTEVKVYETRLAIEAGAKEIDVVQNIGFLRSGWDERVESDIHDVVEAAAPLPVKVIFEIAYLTDDEIVRSCKAAVRAGAAFVKTATGHAPSGATPEAVTLMRNSVPSNVVVKAAGGVKTLDSFIAHYKAGARRFGINVPFTKQIITELEARGSVELPD